jgi:hypothetical protein
MQAERGKTYFTSKISLLLNMACCKKIQFLALFLQVQGFIFAIALQVIYQPLLVQPLMEGSDKG